MIPIAVASIVEGSGEVEALPVLLKRLFAASGLTGRPEVNRPIRVKAAGSPSVCPFATTRWFTNPSSRGISRSMKPSRYPHFAGSDAG